MEDRAPYHTAPRGARNLAEPLAAWLRPLGFTTQPQALPTLSVLTASWTSPRQERFELTYTWQAGPGPAEATVQLRVLYPDLRIDTLCASQRVRRLKEVRLLLTNCVRWQNARLLATLPHPAL